MELERMDNRTSLGMGHLQSFKNRASFLIKDGLKIARLALVDVSAAELMTEDATNADEWGPTTKQMAEISHVIYNSEDYLRVVHVLHQRFSLSTKKYWRQVHKSLILLEYLLCHGPEHLVMEFRQDKDRLEEFTRFVYVDWKEIDRGSALQRRAKHVLHILMNESAYKEERTRAQKISRGISGFGNQSLHQNKPARSEAYDTVPHSKSSSSLFKSNSAGDVTTLLADKGDLPSSRRDTKKTFPNSHSMIELDADISSPSTSETSDWSTFSSSSCGDNLNASDRSTNSFGTISFSSDANPNDESPTSTLSFRKTAHILDMDSFASELEPTVVEDLPLKMPLPPKFRTFVMPRPPAAQLHLVIPKAEDGPPLDSTRLSQPQKLLPPPPMAEYKCVMPRPPQSGSRVRRQQPRGLKPTHDAIPDLINI